MKNRPNRRRKPLEGDRGRAEHARRQQQEEALDDALENTFPASDAVSIVQPAPRTAALDIKMVCSIASLNRSSLGSSIAKLWSCRQHRKRPENQPVLLEQ
jgi:hypothetical protein